MDSVAGMSEAADGSARNRAVARAPEVRRLLLEAYDAGKRDLPWREDADPYRVWVSEVMLQQTRVETVIPYYKEWMRRFPDLDALASAHEEEVLRVWQGLGYYSRAKNLLGSAKVVRETFGGSLPSSSSELRALPGFGEYTAGAVASIAFGEVVPAVDGNVRRVLSRLFDLLHPRVSELRNLAGSLVDPVRPGDFNQAIMELGALVCTPRSPRCANCPLGDLCLARQRGTVEERPGRKEKRAVPEVEMAVVVAVGGASGQMRFLLRKRPPEGLLAGLWEFPGVELREGEEPGPAVTALAAELGLAPAPHRRDAGPDSPSPGNRSVEQGWRATSEVGPISFGTVTHTFTHLKVRYRSFGVRVKAFGEPPSGGRWLTTEEIDGVPLPVAQGRIFTSVLEAMEGGVF